jgi:thiamine-monophosphate kinase
MGQKLFELGERGVIRRLRETIPGLDVIGDDSAVLTSIACPVVTTDSFFEGTHFHRWWAPPQVLGRRLLEATLSDIAAMGAGTGWVFVAVTLDPEMELDWLLSFYRGLAQRDDVVLAGGETVRGPRFGVTLTAIGEGNDPKTLLRRSCLMPGDILWIGGLVGRALDAPRLLGEAGGMMGDPLTPMKNELDGEFMDQLRAFLCPRAQLKLSWRLREAGVRCAIDISDGLLSEARHLCDESAVDIILELDDPIFFPSVRGRLLEASAAGEDFILLFGAPSGLDLSGSGCLRVGRAEAGRDGLKVLLRGMEVEVDSIGYDHMEVE